MIKTSTTRSEIRQVLTQDKAVLWFRESLIEHFDHRKNLTGASSAERLWQIKGHADVLRYLEDVDLLLALYDIEEE